MPYRMAMNSKLHEGVALTVYCRNGWGPGGSNPKAAQPCCYVYVVDLERFEMGLLIRVGTGRLPQTIYWKKLFYDKVIIIKYFGFLLGALVWQQSTEIFFCVVCNWSWMRNLVLKRFDWKIMNVRDSTP